MMNRNKFVLAGLAAALIVPAANSAEPLGALATNNRAPRSRNTEATEPYMKTQVQAQLRLDLDKNVDQVHFVRDNNDPYVVTRVYHLKHADPYEIRPFVRNAIQSRRVKDDPTTVDCIKYNDGKGALIVSAEEYRFSTSDKNGMSIDQIVAALDLPKITSSSGQTTYLYFPKYWAASDIAKFVRQVGANVAGDDVELAFGRDSIQYDNGLNAVLMYMPGYSAGNIEKMIKEYDIPPYDVTVDYMLYELSAENDTQIGVDFQSWKNNEGMDFFSVGGKYRNNWSASWAGGATKNGSSKTSFLNFNPKWNTRYLDFLAAKGKAKILTEGNLVITNQYEGSFDVLTNLFNFPQAEEPGASKTVIDGYATMTGNVVTNRAEAAEGDLRIVATDSNGKSVDITRNFTSAKLTVAKILTTGGQENYGVRVKDRRGKAELKCRTFALESYDGSAWSSVDLDWQTGNNLEVAKDFPISTTPAAVDYGFRFKAFADVSEKASILTVNIVNDSLIGWNSNGTPRINRDTDFSTKVMIDNAGTEVVIGGLERSSLVSSVSGVPWLKKLPVLGYLFSTESQSTKKSRMVLVMRCKMTDPNAPLSGTALDTAKTVNGKLVKAGERVPYASGQYLIGDNK